MSVKHTLSATLIPPGKPGKTADKYAASVEAEVAVKLPAWLEANKEVLARVSAHNKAAA